MSNATSSQQDPPPGSERTIKWIHPRKGEVDLKVYRGIDGRDYVSMSQAPNITGYSRTKTEEFILNWADEGKLQRYTFGGKSVYVPMESVIELRKWLLQGQVVIGKRPATRGKKEEPAD